MGRRALVVCADDYAMSEAVSLGIRDLLERGRVSATSCLCLAPGWTRQGPALREHAGRGEIGLHLGLTDFPPLGPMPRLAPEGRLPSLHRLLIAAYAGTLDRAEIAAELGRQLDAFEAVLGRLADFIDGHHHIHVLPVVRDVVLELLTTRGLGGRLWVRSTCEPMRWIVTRRAAVEKAAALALAGRGLDRRLEAVGITRNDSFRGVTELRSAARVPELFRRFLRGDGTRPLLMCHPARAGVGGADALTAQRVAEYAYLGGQDFVRDLEAAGLTAGRWLPPGTSLQEIAEQRG